MASGSNPETPSELRNGGNERMSSYSSTNACFRWGCRICPACWSSHSWLPMRRKSGHGLLPQVQPSPRLWGWLAFGPGFAARGWTGFVPAVALWGGCFLFMYLHTCSPIHPSVFTSVRSTSQQQNSAFSLNSSGAHCLVFSCCYCCGFGFLLLFFSHLKLYLLHKKIGVNDRK